MKFLFGIFGKNFHEIMKKFPISKDAFNHNNCYICNNNEGKIRYPSFVSNNKKTLFVNGIFIFKNTTLDNFAEDPKGAFHLILENKLSEIPYEFVNGAYNAVILEEPTIYLFNDFMALSPLYYCIKDDTLIFSTSIRFLVTYLESEWDLEAINEFLQLGYNFSYKTIFKNIYSLPPASLLIFNEKLKIDTYATFPRMPEIKSDQHEIENEIHNAIKTSIQRLYSKKFKYALSLTGGMDSRLIFLEWPNKQELLTETSGENTSDYLKAHELVKELGNIELHELENLYADKYLDGFQAYYDLCDNPTKLLTSYNYYHLKWKIERGADIHLTGAGGELFNGENLYLNRKPLYLVREAFLSYTYHKLDEVSKENLIRKAMYAEYKKKLPEMLDGEYRINTDGIIRSIVQKLDTFLGNPGFKETYLERFRTYMQANFAYFPLSIVASCSDIPLLPYNDRDLIMLVCKYHPSSRELRRLEIAILKKHAEAMHIPIDTTHLKLSSPYFAHKFMRVLRMVFNIGYHKKVPFIQKGDPPKYRASKYFDHLMTDYREYIKSSILNCQFYNKTKIQQYINEIDKVHSFNFFSHHSESTNISILFRLAKSEKTTKETHTLQQHSR